MQRGRPPGTFTSVAPKIGTSAQPSRRAASSSAVASMMALEVLAVAVVAPRSPRRVRADMSLADRLRLMVLTDAALLAGRDAVGACRAAVAGGATAIQVRWKAGTPFQVAELTRALVAALAVPVLVNDRVDVALAAGAAGAHLGQDDVPP